MGFSKSVFAKRLNKSKLFVLAFVASIISCGLATVAFSSSVFAAEVVDSFGLYTAPDGVRWEWEVVSDSENTEEPQKINLMFYDKPENLTTVTMPSYTDMTTVSGVTPASDTYYVRNANQESQDTRFTNPDPARRTGGADVTVLDMTNTSKVQIMGVKPIINPETEVELIFGENMVIGDGFSFSKKITLSICASGRFERHYEYVGYYSNGDPIKEYYYYCSYSIETVIDNPQDYIDGFNSLSLSDQVNYEYDYDDFGYVYADRHIKENQFDPTKNYAFAIKPETSYSYSIVEGAFEGYRLKLTNFDKIKYVGFQAFKNATLNSLNTNVVIGAGQTFGEGTFAGTNVTSVSFEGTTTYPSMFKDCSQLSSIDFGNIETVSYSTFENVPISSLDLSTTNIRVVLGRAFKNTGISELNLGNVEKLGFEAFADNNIRQLDFPKSIKELLDGNVFLWNPLEDVTVRYDTYQKGLPLGFVETLGCGGTSGIDNSASHMYCMNLQLKTLTLVAPYSSDEPIDWTRHGEATKFWTGDYDARESYKLRKKTFTEYSTAIMNPGVLKNMISGDYFNGFGALERIFIGDGYEYIGDGAFYSYRFYREANNTLKEISFPNTLLGIGRNAFEKLISGNGGDVEGAKYGSFWIKQAHPDVELPNSLIYIGEKAFLYDTALFSRVDMPNLEYIGAHAFENTNTQDIYFYNKLRYIGENAFYYYTYDSGYNAGNHVFEGKRNVFFDSDVAVSVDVGMYYSPARMRFGNIVYGENVHSLPGGCSNALTAEQCYGSYGSGNTWKGTSWHKARIDSIDMSESKILEIPGALYNSAIIGKITLPKGLMAIGPAAFYGAHIDEELVLPDSIVQIGASAFNARGIVWNTEPYIDEDVVFDSNSEMYYYELENYGAGITITKLPASLNKVGIGAFWGDRKLTGVVDLPNLTEIYTSAFGGTSISSAVWYPNMIAKSEPYIFDANSYLKEVTIDGSFTTSMERVFGGHYNQGYASMNDNWFYNEEQRHYNKITIGKNASLPWGFFFQIEADTIDLSAVESKEIPAGLFVGVHAKTIILPDDLEVINSSAFYNAQVEDELILPNTLKVIESGAFINSDYVGCMEAGHDNCTEYGSHIDIVKLPDSIESIGDASFYGRYDLEIDVDLPNLKRIGTSAFMKSGIRDVTIHDGIEFIGRGAFEYVPTLRSITLDCDFYGVIDDSVSFYGVFSTLSHRETAAGHNQSIMGSSFDSIVFTEKNITNPLDGYGLSFFTINNVDIENAQWTYIPKLFLYSAHVTEPITIPASIESIGDEAFQWSDITLANTFFEGLETIGKAAFYGASVKGDLVIPFSVKSVGWAAFNAGDTDTHYDTVTIKAPLDYEKTNNQAVFQMFWNAKMDKLIIESPMLPVLGTLQAEPVMPHEGEAWGLKDDDTYGYIMTTPTLRFDGEPEFHAMTMREVVIKNLPQITANAFEDCANLEKVDLSGHDSLTRISHHAFNNADKLKTFVFGDGLVGKDVALEEYAFRGTAIEIMGDKNTDFALTAANFNAEDAAVFSEMPKLTTVYVPSTFTIQPAFVDTEKSLNGSTIPAYTFANDPELKEVTLDYQLSKVDESAFLYDNKLEKLFVWGNTDINENDVELTIPEQTTIFAYSDAPAEAYANDESRNDYDGKFYALDEVLYLTSNKSKVLLEQDEEGNNTGFDKTGLKLYGLRRDGVILESDWQDYNTAFKRTETPEGINISFEEGRGALGPDDAAIAATVFDAPKPFNAISLANQNFANVDYEFLTMPSSDNPLIIVHYPDGYTGNIRNTTLLSTTIEEIIEDITDPTPEPEPEDELEVPDTGSYGALIGAATSSVSIATIIVLGGIFITKRRH